VEQKKRYVAHFPQLSLTAPVAEQQLNDIHVGDEFIFTAEVYLGELLPEDVSVQLYYGKVNVHNEIIESSSADMTMLTDHGDNNYTYQYNLTCEHSGRFGLTARIVPVGSDWEKSVPGFMTWPNS
jgi:starch phosphorylase